MNTMNRFQLSMAVMLLIVLLIVLAPFNPSAFAEQVSATQVTGRERLNTSQEPNANSDWYMYGYNSQHTFFNLNETTLRLPMSRTSRSPGVCQLLYPMRLLQHMERLGTPLQEICSLHSIYLHKSQIGHGCLLKENSSVKQVE